MFSHYQLQAGLRSSSLLRRTIERYRRMQGYSTVTTPKFRIASRHLPLQRDPASGLLTSIARSFSPSPTMRTNCLAHVYKLPWIQRYPHRAVSAKT